jgi:hypothetical protein
MMKQTGHKYPQCITLFAIIIMGKVKVVDGEGEGILF